MSVLMIGNVYTNLRWKKSYQPLSMHRLLLKVRYMLCSILRQQRSMGKRKRKGAYGRTEATKTRLHNLPKQGDRLFLLAEYASSSNSQLGQTAVIGHLQLEVQYVEYFRFRNVRGGSGSEFGACDSTGLCSGLGSQGRGNIGSSGDVGLGKCTKRDSANRSSGRRFGRNSRHPGSRSWSGSRGSAGSGSRSSAGSGGGTGNGSVTRGSGHPRSRRCDRFPTGSQGGSRGGRCLSCGSRPAGGRGRHRFPDRLRYSSGRPATGCRCRLRSRDDLRWRSLRRCLPRVLLGIDINLVRRHNLRSQIFLPSGPSFLPLPDSFDFRQERLLFLCPPEYAVYCQLPAILGSALNTNPDVGSPIILMPFAETFLPAKSSPSSSLPCSF